MDAEDELICLRARQLSERKLLKCMDIWSEAAVLLTPDKREDLVARSERVARISLTCDRVLERMAEVPGVLAVDHDKRDPYKRFQDLRTPPNQIHIMQDVEGHLCPPEHRSCDVSQNDLEPHLIAARLIEEAGGQLVGRTKLQKVACLATLAGFLDAFPFEYRHYGPFSERLAGSMEIATGLRIVEEKEERADWEACTQSTGRLKGSLLDTTLTGAGSSPGLPRSDRSFWS